MKTKIYNAYSDPGHAWVKVSRSELVKLGIDKDITPYSYQRKDKVYLEEDCDLSTFVKAMENKGIQVKFREFVARTKSSKIRSYNNYVSGV